MDVPDIYLDRLVKCVRCHEMYVPEHDGRRGEVTTATLDEKLPPEPDPREFCGINTDRDKLIAMCVHAKARGNGARYHYLAAYSNAQNALLRDTWQAAAAEWHTAHSLLRFVNRPRAQPLVDRARREFIQLASDQLVDFVQQYEREYHHETAHLPPRVRRKRVEKIADAFRSMLNGQTPSLVEPAVLSQVERVADEWATRISA